MIGYVPKAASQQGPIATPLKWTAREAFALRPCRAKNQI